MSYFHNQARRRWLVLAIGIALLTLVGVARHDYSEAKLGHSAWRPDPLGVRIEQFVRNPNPFSDIFGVDSTVPACLAFLRERRLSSSGRYSKITAKDSTALYEPPCEFEVQKRPEFHYSIADGLATSFGFATAIFLAVGLLGFAATYGHLGWRRLSLVSGGVAALLFGLYNRNRMYPEEAVASGLVAGLAVMTLILVLRECALWVQRGFVAHDKDST